MRSRSLRSSRCATSAATAADDTFSSSAFSIAYAASATRRSKSSRCAFSLARACAANSSATNAAAFAASASARSLRAFSSAFSASATSLSRRTRASSASAFSLRNRTSAAKTSSCKTCACVCASSTSCHPASISALTVSNSLAASSTFLTAVLYSSDTTASSSASGVKTLSPGGLLLRLPWCLTRLVNSRWRWSSSLISSRPLVH
mmetsp:Transcript_58344/g.85502  ORF Transcript_58344/g.85502 Transcript_58344/m.85502 type:complete len:205 (-) Transcript_58344:221-835(-)